MSECSRNIVCTGAQPIGIIDHLQFGNPENPESFWSLEESVRAIADFCRFMEIPVVGGKVSLYNETAGGPIKPTPLVGCLGIIEKVAQITRPVLEPGNSIFILGSTKDEMGGSEYYEYYHRILAGTVPDVDLKTDKLNKKVMLSLIKDKMVTCAHDCSNGGFAIALCETALAGRTGLEVDLDLLPNSCSRVDNLLFSESQSRFIFATRDPKSVENSLRDLDGVEYAEIGSSLYPSDNKIVLRNLGSTIICTSVDELEDKYNTLRKIMSGAVPD